MANDNSDESLSPFDELKTLNNSLNKICQVRETNHIMSLIIKELILSTAADQGVINLVENLRGEELTTVVRNAGRETDGIPYKLNNQISGWVLTHRQLLKIDSLENDDRFRNLTSGNSAVHSIICSPMIARGEIIGLVTLVRDKNKNPFSEKESRLTGILTSQSANMLSNSILLDKLAKNCELLELSQKKLSEENAQLRKQPNRQFQFENIIGKSPSIRNAMTLVSKFGAHNSPVLITGDTGTGKDLFAKAIHLASERKNNQFVVKNCSVKSESLLESELFGHTRGSFTGAIRDKIGLFKEADGGTIFLDEIADAPLTTQAAILRVIQNGEIRPIGASRTEFVNVRIISATNKDLREMIKKGEFREDLYYRLNTFILELPSLFQRKDDIPLLAAYFLNKLKISTGKENLTITPAAMDCLLKYSWPGNVRQLEHELERAAVICDSDERIDLEHFSIDKSCVEMNTDTKFGYHGKLRDTVERVEKQVICATLKEYKGNILQVSKVLGLTRKGLKDKISRYKITVDKD